jgi:YD repeat-containing protein
MPSVLVNTTTLNLIIQDTDMSYSGRGPGVGITRTYNADDSRDGSFGPSWTFNYNVQLTENPNGRIDVRRETGTIHSFTRSGGVYYGPAGVYDTLVKNADGTYSLKMKGSKVTQKFNSSGRLTGVSDRNGNTVSLQYDANDRLISVVDAAGRITSLAYGPNGKISSVTDPLGRTATYAYGANNNLVTTEPVRENWTVT